MLSADERRQRLEALLERVQRNRGSLGQQGVAAPAAHAPIGSEEPEVAFDLSEGDVAFEVDEVDAFEDTEDTIEIDEELAEEELEFDTDDEVIELTADDEIAEAVEEPVIELSMSEEVSENDTLEMAEPPVQMPQLPLPGAPPPITIAEVPFDDDEPEIEISYGTDEAIALQEELSLEGEIPEMLSTPAPKPIPLDDLPSLTEEQTAPEPDKALTPSPKGGTQPALKPAEPAIKPAEPALKPAGPAIKPAEPALKPAGPALKPAKPAFTPARPTPRPAEQALKPLTAIAKQAPARKPAVPKVSGLPVRPATPTPASTTQPPARFVGKKPAGDVEVAEFVEAEPLRRPKTLGDLLGMALRVGRK